MDTTPLEMEAIMGRTGCHWMDDKGKMGKLPVINIPTEVPVLKSLLNVSFDILTATSSRSSPLVPCRIFTRFPMLFSQM